MSFEKMSNNEEEKPQSAQEAVQKFRNITETLKKKREERAKRAISGFQEEPAGQTKESELESELPGEKDIEIAFENLEQQKAEEIAKEQDEILDANLKERKALLKAIEQEGIEPNMLRE